MIAQRRVPFFTSGSKFIISEFYAPGGHACQWLAGGWLVNEHNPQPVEHRSDREVGVGDQQGAHRILSGLGRFYLNFSDSLDSFSRFMRLGQIPCLRLYFLIKTKDPMPQLALSSLPSPEGLPHKLDRLCQLLRQSTHVTGSLSLSRKQTPFLLRNNHVISSQMAWTEVWYTLYLGCASGRAEGGQASRLRALNKKCVRRQKAAAHKHGGTRTFPLMTKPPVFT